MGSSESARAGKAQPQFEARTQRIRKLWQNVGKALKDFEQRAEKDPASCAKEALRKVAYELNLYRVTFKHQFDLDLEGKQEWWRRAPLPSDPNSRALFIDCVLLYQMFDGVWQLYRDAIARPDLRGENMCRAICEIYLAAKYTEPCLLTASTEIVIKQLPERAREEAVAEELTGYFLAHLSTTPRYRLGRALREIGPPGEALRWELPAQALQAWAEREDAIVVLKDLKNRIADSIARHVSTSPAEAGQASEIAALAAFADKERTLKQGRDAGLAPREYEIFKLFVENPGIKYREVADKLGVSVGTVGKTKARIAQALAQAG